MSDVRQDPDVDDFHICDTVPKFKKVELNNGVWLDEGSSLLEQKNMKWKEKHKIIM